VDDLTFVKSSTYGKGDVMTQSEPTVFIVDDDPSVLKGLSLLVKSVKLNVEAYSSAQEFLDSYNPVQPGCLLIDMRMPGISGLELQEILHSMNILIPTIIITGYGEVTYAVQAMKNGAIDFIEKPFKGQYLLDQVHKAIAEDAQIRKKQAQQQVVSASLALLTPREREVMDLVIAGKANKVIALELGLSTKTVELHRAHMMKKMKVDSVAELVVLFISATKE
jgi:RNA polymerase sigma factor (sigma-70 family)